MTKMRAAQVSGAKGKFEMVEAYDRMMSGKTGFRVILTMR
jgi:hypothetical protein